MASAFETSPVDVLNKLLTPTKKDILSIPTMTASTERFLKKQEKRKMAPLFTGSDARPRKNHCFEPALYNDSFEPIRKAFVNHLTVNNGCVTQKLNGCHNLLTLVLISNI